jgi:hypothetical protein
MSIVTGTVVKISIDVSVEKKDGGSYPGWVLVYEDQNGEIRKIAKHMNSLKYLPDFSKNLKELSVGDRFTLEMVKKGDFLNPVSIVKGFEGVPSTPNAQQSVPVQSSGPSTFEVNNILKEKQMKLDEVKQPIYIRQSALKATSELAEILGLKTEVEIFAQSKRFVRYLETGDTGAIEDLMNDDLGIE